MPRPRPASSATPAATSGVSVCPEQPCRDDAVLHALPRASCTPPPPIADALCVAAALVISQSILVTPSLSCCYISGILVSLPINAPPAIINYAHPPARRNGCDRLRSYVRRRLHNGALQSTQPRDIARRSFHAEVTPHDTVSPQLVRHSMMCRSHTCRTGTSTSDAAISAEHATGMDALPFADRALARVGRRRRADGVFAPSRCSRWSDRHAEAARGSTVSPTSPY